MIAGLGKLDVLKEIYTKVIVPYEVCEEIEAGGKAGFAVKEFNQAEWLKKLKSPVKLTPYLLNILDRGEAAVIQVALDSKTDTVCIDELVGRRMARITGLNVTGSIGMLLKLKRQGIKISIKRVIENMKRRGIWLGKAIEEYALKHAKE